MEDHLRENYFLIAKAMGIIAFVIGGMVTGRDQTSSAVKILLAGAMFLFFSVASELADGMPRRIFWYMTEGAAAVMALLFAPFVGLFFLTVTYLDIVGRLAPIDILGALALMALVPSFDLNAGYCLMLILFTMVIYYQHYKIVGWYKAATDDNLKQESRLKSDIENNNLAHRAELRQSRLRHENELLEEKSRISQALHDKLGHSINGSIYKLEASRVLIDKDPERSSSILEEVIDSLRGSMDEIRVIIRNERPDKKRMALKSLQALVAECEEEYGIDAALSVTGDDRAIPENIWEVILDNTFEAVTNALKYSGCSSISIDINVLAEVVRATIADNGKGASVVEESMGIQGMKERVRRVKGYIDIDPVGGFTINMILPLGKVGKSGAAEAEAEIAQGSAHRLED